MVSILEKQDEQSISIHELFSETKDKFDNIDEFIISLDVLYCLNMIDVDLENEIIEYATRD